MFRRGRPERAAMLAVLSGFVLTCPPC